MLICSVVFAVSVWLSQGTCYWDLSHYMNTIQWRWWSNVFFQKCPHSLHFYVTGMKYFKIKNYNCIIIQPGKILSKNKQGSIFMSRMSLYAEKDRWSITKITMRVSLWRNTHIEYSTCYHAYSELSGAMVLVWTSATQSMDPYCNNREYVLK